MALAIGEMSQDVGCGLCFLCRHPMCRKRPEDLEVDRVLQSFIAQGLVIADQHGASVLVHVGRIDVVSQPETLLLVEAANDGIGDRERDAVEDGQNIEDIVVGDPQSGQQSLDLGDLPRATCYDGHVDDPGGVGGRL